MFGRRFVTARGSFLQSKGSRRGAVAPLTAIMMVPLLGLVAFAIDAGWMALSRSGLQDAADAAALAGAQQLIGQATPSVSGNGSYVLQNGFTQYYMPGAGAQQTMIVNAATAAAIKSAKDFATYHSAGAVDHLVLLDSDIEFGMTDAGGNYTRLVAPYTTFPNTIKVMLRLDANANGSLRLFFAPVLGTNTMDLQARASATIYTGTIDSFNPGTSRSSRILPMAYDVNHWNNYLRTGNSPDGTQAVADASGNSQLQVYPSPSTFPGNWGLLSLDQQNDNPATIGKWVGSGASGSDLQQEINAKLLPLSLHDPNQWDWKGFVFDNSSVQYLNGHTGDTFILPLFKPVNQGSPPTYSGYQPGVDQNGFRNYNIVQFAGVKISSPQQSSNIMIQPAPLIDPNAVFRQLVPATAPADPAQLRTLFASPKLTQ
jgi:Flp pilus assembly protein TadG